ncbi:cilia- and flagella-associated protein 251-like [Pempheris klunzingeri]|uniref:cilia- and flagella-associated protein 251-like n=1 Tax=Pempheris klunzingeri TaxID=3127111 RepID=UPI00398031F6
MDGLFFLFPSAKDSLRGRHLHLSSLGDSKYHFSEERAGPVSPEPVHSAGQEIAKALNEVVEEEAGGIWEDKLVQREKREDEGGGEAEEGGMEREDGEAQDEEADERKSKEERGVQHDETKGREESVESDDEAAESLMEEENEVKEEEEKHEFEEDSDEVVERCFKSNQDGGRGELERSIGDEERQNKSEEDELEINSKREQEKEKEEDGESSVALGRCSVSQRKATESAEEVIERCFLSEGGETDMEGFDVDSESEGENPQTASESEKEEMFETEAAQVQSAKLGKKTALTDHSTLGRKRRTLAGMMKNVTKQCPLPAEVGFGVTLCMFTSASHSLPSPRPQSCLIPACSPQNPMPLRTGLDSSDPCCH